MLIVKNLSTGYEDNAILKDVSFVQRAGEVICVLGANGCGKSTLFRSLLGFIPFFKGEVRLDDRPVDKFSRQETAREIAWLPQSHIQIFGHRVLDLVLMGRTCHLSVWGAPGVKDREISLEALEELGITRLKDRSCKELSGGELQMVLFARALAQGSKLLLLDEPLSNLDFGNRIRIMRIMRELAQKGYMVLYSCHDPDQVMQHADKVLLIRDGYSIAFGPPAEVLDEKAIYQIYGVEAKKMCVTESYSGMKRCLYYLVPMEDGSLTECWSPPNVAY